MADNEERVFYDESWEFQNNTSDRMLFKSNDFETMYTDPETLEEYPEWKNDFEARFPEDTYEDTTQLKTFMDWIVTTDRSAATGDALEESVTIDGTTYTNDTAAYRLAKFGAEVGDYVEVDSFIFYYIFSELFLLVDSRAKNLFIGFHGSECSIEGIRRKLVAEPYDMDTGLGTNNEGTLTYGYSLEDSDTISGANVFNGQDSVMWCNLRDTKRAAIVQMYQTLRSSGGLSLSAIEARYEAAQEAWPEAVWNEDAYAKYIEPLVNPEGGKEPTDFYLPMCQGSKEQQRKWWLTNRFAYMDSKWNAGDALNQVIQLRGYAKDDITVTPYIDLYSTVKFGSYLVQTRGQAGVSETMECPIDTLNDTEIYIYSAPHIASVGDLSGLKVGVADFSAAVSLQEVKVGDSDSNYDNPNMKRLSFGNNILLKKIDARNCSNLGTDEQKTVDVSNCAVLEEAYFDGTAIQGLTLPNGGVLKKLHVPATMTNLTILNQPNITELVVAGYTNISTLRIENSSVDTLAILNNVPATTRVRLIGIDWTCQDSDEIEDILDLLDTMRGLDESGNNVAKAQVSGIIRTTSLTGAQVASYQERYPYIEYDAAVESTRTYADYDGTVLKRVTCIDGVPQDTAPANPTRTSTAQYSFTFVGWSKSMDAETADADALDNVLADRTIYAAYSRTVRTYTVTWKNRDNTVLETDTDVPYGTTPTYNGATPTYNGQTSNGWTPAVGAITGDTVYTAKYAIQYTVSFYNGSTLLTTATVDEGGTAVYTGSTPVNSEDSSLAFLGWTRTSGGTTADANALVNITANTSVYAAFESAVEVAEITDSWDTIIANIDNGTYSSVYKVGNYKPLDLGTEGTINMQIVAMDADELADGSGYAPLTFIGMELLKTDRTFDNNGGVAGGWANTRNTSLRYYIDNTIYSLIPSTISSRIQSVTKQFYGYESFGNRQLLETTNKLFIPNNVELCVPYITDAGTISYSGVYTQENISRIKKISGTTTPADYWLRSDGYDNWQVAYVIGSGGSSSTSRKTNVKYICLGFCLA